MHLTKLLILIILFVSCSETIEIDNPTSDALKIDIGPDQTVTIKAYENKKVSISGNGHDIYTNGKLVGTLNLHGAGDYLLNPTLSTYYIEEVAYGRDDREMTYKIMKNSSPSKDRIESTFLFIDDTPYIGYAREDSSLLIKNIWDYGVQESLPNQIKTSSGSGLRKKIYRDYLFLEHAKKIVEKAMKED